MGVPPPQPPFTGVSPPCPPQLLQWWDSNRQCWANLPPLPAQAKQHDVGRLLRAGSQIGVRAHFGLADPLSPTLQLEALWGSGAAPAALVPPTPVLQGSCCCKFWGPTKPSASPPQPSILPLLCFGAGGVQPTLNSKPAITPFSQPSPCPPCSHGAGRSIPAAAPRSPPSRSPPPPLPGLHPGLHPAALHALYLPHPFLYGYV